MAPPQVDRQGQPYSTRCDAAHRTRGRGGPYIVGLTLAVNLGGLMVARGGGGIMFPQEMSQGNRTRATTRANTFQ